MKALFSKKTWTVLLLVSFYLLLVYVWQTSNSNFDKLGDNLESNFSGFWQVCRSGNFANELAKRAMGRRGGFDDGDVFQNYMKIPVFTGMTDVSVGIFTKEYALEDRDPGVLEMQRCLNKLGFLVAKSGAGSTGQETDKFGLGTEDALKRFQKHNELICKLGVPDLVTRVALNKACQ